LGIVSNFGFRASDLITMIRRETIKQAIEAIARRSPEVGYTLDEMLAMGMIDAPRPGQETMLGEDFYFLFDGYKARVSKFLYINKGTVPIEERLLVKYGELLKKRELLERGEAAESMEASKAIRKAGLRFMVLHEIDYAIRRMEESGGIDPRRWIPFLEELKTQQEPLAIPADADPLYCGTLEGGIQAFFSIFPLHMDSLLQVADINLEFFHVRFFLNRLMKDQLKNCFVCVTGNRVNRVNQILGIIYILFKQRMFSRNLVIDFVATLRGKTGDPAAAEAPRGVGAFLMAGVWMEWKTGALPARDMTLDSEVGARGFYASIGFQPRGFAEFVLSSPKGSLLLSILRMHCSRRQLPPKAVQALAGAIRKQVKSLRRNAETEKERAERRRVIETLKAYLTSAAVSGDAEAILQLISKYRKKIPESDALIRYALESGSSGTKNDAIKATPGARC